MVPMSGLDEHVLGGFKPFGLRRWRAICSCGYETGPVAGRDTEARWKPLVNCSSPSTVPASRTPARRWGSR